MVFIHWKKGKGGISVLWMALVMVLMISLTACGGKTNEDPCKDGHHYESGKCVVCGTADPEDKTEPEKEEFTYKGKTGQGSDAFMGDPQDVYWVDASVQKPENYTKIVGFKLNVKMTKIDYYGGGKETKTFACGMILTTKGAHEPDEYVFTYPNEQSPSFDLSTQNVAAFGVGEAGWLVKNVFTGGISSSLDMKEGDTTTLIYQGETALFKENEPVLTLVSFLGEFEYQSIEWILGEPEEITEEPWEKVEVVEYMDVSTVPAGVENNGYNYVDITIPDTGMDSYPVVLWIHGGGYITGSRKNCLLETTKEYMLAQGYAWVSADYTLTQTESIDGKTVYTQGGMPQMLYDLKTAVRFLRANASAYHLNTDYIVVMGESAGAGLATLLATSNGETGELYEDTQMGWADQSSDVQAAAAICPPTIFLDDQIGNMYAYIGEEFAAYYGSDEELKAEIEDKAYAWSPSEHVSVDSVPLFLSFSQEDETVTQEHYQAMKDALDAVFTAEEMEEAGMVLMNYQKGGHVDRATFDSYTAYVTLAKWCNSQRDKVLCK